MEKIEIGDVVTWDHSIYPSGKPQYGVASSIQDNKIWCDVWYIDSDLKQPIKNSRGYVSYQDVILIRKDDPKKDMSKCHKHHELIKKWIEDPNRYDVYVYDVENSYWIHSGSAPLWLQNRKYMIEDKMNNIGYAAIEKFVCNMQNLMENSNPC